MACSFTVESIEPAYAGPPKKSGPKKSGGGGKKPPYTLPARPSYWDPFKQMNPDFDGQTRPSPTPRDCKVTCPGTYSDECEAKIAAICDTTPSGHPSGPCKGIPNPSGPPAVDAFYPDPSGGVHDIILCSSIAHSLHSDDPDSDITGLSGILR